MFTQCKYFNIYFSNVLCILVIKSLSLFVLHFSETDLQSAFKRRCSGIEKLLWNNASLLDDVLHRSLFRGVQVDLVLGQDFQDGPQL